MTQKLQKLERERWQNLQRLNFNHNSSNLNHSEQDCAGKSKAIYAQSRPTSKKQIKTESQMKMIRRQVMALEKRLKPKVERRQAEIERFCRLHDGLQEWMRAEAVKSKERAHVERLKRATQAFANEDLYQGNVLFCNDTFTKNLRKGPRHGHGQLIRNDGSVMYEGEFDHGMKHGHGTYYFQNGDVYTGNFAGGVQERAW